MEPAVSNQQRYGGMIHLGGGAERSYTGFPGISYQTPGQGRPGGTPSKAGEIRKRVKRRGLSTAVGIEKGEKTGNRAKPTSTTTEE